MSTPRKKKKKTSTGSRLKSQHSKVKSASRVSATDQSNTRPLNSSVSSPKRKKRTKSSQKNNARQQHSRYATANTAAVGSKSKNKNRNRNTSSNNPNTPKKKKSKKPRNRPTNKIKTRNKKNRSHNKAATTNNALHSTNSHKNHIKSSQTSPNALLPNSPMQSVHSNSSYDNQRKRTASNPRKFRHKFNMTEMHLVVSQISDMKKSWKTPAEDAMGKIYEIVDMEERPHLNGKHCKITLILDDDNYRVALLGNSSEHVVAHENLVIAFETENLFSLWESQSKKPSKRSTYGQGLDGDGMHNDDMHSPPNQDIDDMYTIQQFEHTFNDTYEFRRLDFYCISVCIFLGVIVSGAGVFIYLNNESSKDLHAIGAFVSVFGCVFGALIGLYIGCVWYCCAVGKGKMDYYLGRNRCFGFECKCCDCCKYQYFLMVSVIGMCVIGVSVVAWLFFAKFVAMDESESDTNNINVGNTDTNGEIAVNESKLFIGLEVLACLGGIGLCVSGFVVYLCCRNRIVTTAIKGPSIHDEHFED